MADNEKRDYSLIGYMENLSDNIKHFVQNNSIGKAVVIAAALSIPSNVFVQEAEASRAIENDAMHYGVMRDVNDMGLSQTVFADLPQFDMAVNGLEGQEIAPTVMSLSAAQFAELEKIAQSDVIVPDNSNQNSNIGLMSTDSLHISSVDFEKAAEEFNYDLNSKMFVTDRTDLKEFNGNGSYVYFPVRSSGKNDDVKAYVQDPHELRHNDYNMGRNESRDNPEYGFKRQKDMQRIAALSGREYKPSILNDQEFGEFKQVFGKLNQQNARFVPIFSSHPKFSQYKVEFSADLNLSSMQADYLLKNYSNRFTSDVREDLTVKTQSTDLGNDKVNIEPTMVSYKADSSRYLSDGNGYGLAKVNVELEAASKEEAVKLAKVYALKELNNDGRIVDGMVTSLDAGDLVEQRNGKYFLDVTVGGVLAPNSVRESSENIYADSISVGLEMWDESGRKVYTLDDLRKDSNLMHENPELKSNMISVLDNLNADLKNIDFTVDDKIKNTNDIASSSRYSFVEPQVDESIKAEAPIIDVPQYDSKPIVEMSNHLADISDRCVQNLKAEQLARQDLQEFNDKYNSGSFLKDNYNRLKDGLTGNSFKERHQELTDNVDKAVKATDNSISSFYSTCKDLEGSSKGLDFRKIESKGNVFKHALKNGNLGALKNISKELKQDLNDYKATAISLSVKYDRLNEIASVSVGSLVPGMSAVECYKVLAREELNNSYDASFKIPDNKIVDSMLRFGFSADKVKETLDLHSPNFINKGAEAKKLVDNSKKEVLNKDNVKTAETRSSRTVKNHDSGLER